jgi:hypothetical protein
MGTQVDLPGAAPPPVGRKGDKGQVEAWPRVGTNLPGSTAQLRTPRSAH